MDLNFFKMSGAWHCIKLSLVMFLVEDKKDEISTFTGAGIVACLLFPFRDLLLTRYIVKQIDSNQI